MRPRLRERARPTHDAAAADARVVFPRRAGGDGERVGRGVGVGFDAGREGVVGAERVCGVV